MPQQLRFRRGTFSDKYVNPLLFGEPYFNTDINTVQIGGDPNSDITLVSFPYSGSGIITGSLEITGQFTASLQLGYVWVGGAGNISKLIGTASFLAGLSGSRHTILDSGSVQSPRSNLDFVRFNVTDDISNDKTIIKRPPSVTVSGSAPAKPEEGDEWIDNASWKKYVWYLNDSGTDYWVETGIVTPETSSINISGFPYTGHAIIYGSLYVQTSITASVFSGTFSGSYNGDGGGLTNIPAASIVGLNLARISTGSISASVYTDSRTFELKSGSSTIMLVTGSTNNVIFGDALTPREKVHISGSLYVSSFVTSSKALISGSGNNQLIVEGSGSSNPIFTVVGSQGELFSVTDNLSGSLFAITDISGLPVLEAFSDSTVIIGSYQAPALYSSAKITSVSGSNVLYLLPTASYNSAFYDYTVSSGNNLRSGHITAVVNILTGEVVYTEFGTIDIGDTSGVNLSVVVSGSYLAFTGSAASGWIMKTIVKAI